MLMLHNNTAAAFTEIAATSTPKPNIQLCTLRDDPFQRYYLYLPQINVGAVAHGILPPATLVHPCTARVFVTVHGISRNAEEHARLFAPFVERYGVVLVAPIFSANRFAKYQQLGKAGHGKRADQTLHQILAEVQTLTGAAVDSVYLFGFSGGGQFVHRYAMAYPERVARFMVGAAGWYTFPDATLKYPRGIKQRRDLPDVRLEPERFLKVPGGVVVGERDIKAGSALNKAPRLAEQQGRNRLARAQRWAEAMTAAAHDRGLDTRYVMHILPRCGHSFRRGMRRGMGKYVFEYLFGAPDGER
ncbi:MAG: alpha/beta hydrolase [Gammaproteobacteria bacterium]